MTSMSPEMNIFMGMAMGQINKYRQAQDIFKQRVLDDWVKTIKMPRKMKKKRRKELELEWRIANWDPMGLDKFDGLF